MITAQLFRKYALQLVDAAEGYKWGWENPEGTDCSGTVCYPLIMTGYKIRTTADDLYRKIFTKPVSQVSEVDLNRVLAVFYVMQRAWTKLDGTKMPAGSVRHVTPVVGEYVVLHADWNKNEILLKTAKSVRLDYEARGAKAVWRELNIDNADFYSGKLAFGIDPYFDTLDNAT